MGTTTIDTPMGPVTFPDPTAGTPFEQLTLEQQNARSRLRNAELGKMFHKDIGFNQTAPLPAPNISKPRPKPRPRTVGAGGARRSTRLGKGGDPATPAAMDVDTDDQSHHASPPASASEPETIPRDDPMDLDTDNDTRSSGWENELDELDASDLDSRGLEDEEDRDEGDVIHSHC